jgi:hypothetical protein
MKESPVEFVAFSMFPRVLCGFVGSPRVVDPLYGPELQVVRAGDLLQAGFRALCTSLPDVFRQFPALRWRIEIEIEGTPFHLYLIFFF